MFLAVMVTRLTRSEFRQHGIEIHAAISISIRMYSTLFDQ